MDYKRAIQALKTNEVGVSYPFDEYERGRFLGTSYKMPAKPHISIGGIDLYSITYALDEWVKAFDNAVAENIRLREALAEVSEMAKKFK